MHWCFKLKLFLTAIICCADELKMLIFFMQIVSYDSEPIDQRTETALNLLPDIRYHTSMHVLCDAVLDRLKKSKINIHFIVKIACIMINRIRRLLCAYALWGRRDLYRASLAIARDLGFVVPSICSPLLVALYFITQISTGHFLKELFPRFYSNN